MNIKIGDIVKSRPDGPEMKVISIVDGHCNCESSEPKKYLYPENALEVIEPSKEKRGTRIIKLGGV